jgi:hypothetical protein
MKIGLLLTVFSVLSGVAIAGKHKFEKGEKIILWANKGE